MTQLIEISKELLNTGRAAYILGYTTNNNGRVIPYIARNTEACEKLIFNHYAVNNLSVYLKRLLRTADGKIGIVAKGCDIRAIIGLMQENQLKREDVIILGMNCSGVVKEVSDDWSRENTQIKCKYCQLRTPKNADFTIGELEDFEIPDDDQLPVMQKLESMSSSERWDFFESEFSRCIKCYACRQVCPMCYCDQCIAEKSMPGWIETSSSPRGNFAWNIIRAFHMAGRCIGCHECERACPMDIPITLLTRKLGMQVGKEFKYAHGMDINQPTLIGNYNTSDKEDFIK
jgi:formate dehydrogenase subunit beta